MLILPPPSSPHRHLGAWWQVICRRVNTSGTFALCRSSQCHHSLLQCRHSHLVSDWWTAAELSAFWSESHMLRIFCQFWLFDLVTYLGATNSATVCGLSPTVSHLRTSHLSGTTLLLTLFFAISSSSLTAYTFTLSSQWLVLSCHLIGSVVGMGSLLTCWLVDHCCTEHQLVAGLYFCRWHLFGCNFAHISVSFLTDFLFEFRYLQ